MVEGTEYHDRYIEGWNDHDPEAVMAQFADGGTYVDPLFDDPIYGEEIGEFVELTAGRFPDFRFEQRRVLDVESEGVRIEEWTMHGTHEGMREGLPPTGNTIALDGTSVVDLSADGIVAIRGYFDQQQLTEQLGLTFPAVVGQLPTLVAGAVRAKL
ncbi:ester cyclase [Halorarius halobius]|uniref:ester cyclase n=1 Tax=Halorarius halobius TaxID=2962671 RepID=UPI0020CD69EF|nr:nuclear transport factor 2 family protein [Halorarius halobius]